jgi:hypothetical protein
MMDVMIPGKHKYVYLLCTNNLHNFVLYYIFFFCCSLNNVELLERKYFSVDQIKKNELARACGMYRGAERCVQGFSEET